MRALRWYAARNLRVDEIERPVPRPGEALIRVERVGLCGTDLEEYLHGPLDIPVGQPHRRSGAMAPLTPGHEVLGRVVECADRPEWVGRRVVPDVVQGCGTCWWCQRHEEGLCPDLVVLGMHAPGGLAEYMLCSSATLVEVPDSLDSDVAVFAEPVAVAVRAVAKAGDMRGSTIAVVGAGVVGNLILQIAKVQGAHVAVQDPSEGSRGLALQAGAVSAAANRAEGLDQIARLTHDRMADVVFECAGREASLHDAIDLTRRGGTTVLVGLNAKDPTIPWREIVLGEKRLIGTAAHLWDVDVRTAVRLLAENIVNTRSLLGKVVGLNDVGEALEELARPNSLAKVLVDPQR